MGLTKAGELQRLRDEISELDDKIIAAGKVMEDAREASGDDDVAWKTFGKMSNRIKSWGRDRADLMEQLKRSDR